MAFPPGRLIRTYSATCKRGHSCTISVIATTVTSEPVLLVYCPVCDSPHTT